MTDPSLVRYIRIETSKSQVFLPHTAGRYQQKKFKKSLCPIIERLVGCIAFKGRNSGKKVQSVKIMRATLELLNHATGENPIQTVIDAITNCGPREDCTRVGKGGSAKRQAVDVSSMRRVNFAMFQLCLSARKKAMRSIKTMAECLADEILLASKADPASGALVKKTEIEKNAKSNR